MRYEKYSVLGHEVLIPFAESYKDCMMLIQSDEFRINGKQSTIFKIVIRNCLLFNQPILFWFRLASYKGIFNPLCRMIYRVVSRKSQIQIPPETRVGYGLYLGHKMCMIVNSATIIGNNVNLSQFLNIGSNHDTPALIGDNVYIGPNVCVVEDVVIGNNATIGAGAVVTHNVPPNTTVAGVPAKILNNNNPGRYICNRYIVGDVDCE